MTERLYEQDSYRRRFSATVRACRPAADGWAVELDRTAFFPEGGGQAADSGTLGDLPVTDVQLQDGIVLHRLPSPLPVGETTEGEIDWPLRFQRMQKHTGEHIVSGLIHRLYRLDNVGFHLGREDVTLDISGELTREQLDDIEDRANEAVTANVPVTASYPPPQTLQALPYRSKKPLEGPVRIVTVEGYDICACCAPHVARTGEIGLIKLLDAIRYKGGTRIHMQAGGDALRDYRLRYEQTAGIAAALSVRQTEAADAVRRLLTQRDTLSRQLHAAERALALARAETDELGEPPVCRIYEAMDGDTLRQVATALSRRCGGLCAAFAGSDAEGYQYAVVGGDDLPALARRIGEALGGRGGGSAQMIRGRVTATAADIRRFWAELPR